MCSYRRYSSCLLYFYSHIYFVAWISAFRLHCRLTRSFFGTRGRRDFNTSDMSFCSLHYAVCTFLFRFGSLHCVVCVFNKVDMKRIRIQIYYLWNFSRFFFLTPLSITEEILSDTLP